MIQQLKSICTLRVGEKNTFIKIEDLICVSYCDTFAASNTGLFRVSFVIERGVTKDSENMPWHFCDSLLKGESVVSTRLLLELDCFCLANIVTEDILGHKILLL